MRYKILVVVLILASAQIGFAQTAPVTSKVIEGSIMASNKTAFDDLKSAANFSTFVSLIEASGLRNSFAGVNAITLLVPNNKAFENLPAGILDTLRKPENQARLVNYVNGYIIQGKLTSADLSRLIKTGNGQAQLSTVAATKLFAKINNNRNITLTDALGIQTIISRYDIIASNAVIHTITVALPVNLAPIPVN